MGRKVENRENRGVISELRGETEDFLLKRNPPARTPSYTPISHKMIINGIRKELTKHKFDIISTNFRTSNNGDRVFGKIKFYPEKEKFEPDFDSLVRTIAFRNSYDKSMSFGLGVGAEVFVCSNGMFSADMVYLKKHLGDVDEELPKKIIEQLNFVENIYKELNIFKTNLKEIELSKRAQAELLGRFIFEEKILSAAQINIIKEQRRFSKYFSGNMAWDLYNNITESLKMSNPVLMHKHHTKIHNIFKEDIIGIV